MKSDVPPTRFQNFKAATSFFQVGRGGPTFNFLGRDGRPTAAAASSGGAGGGTPNVWLPNDAALASRASPRLCGAAWAEEARAARAAAARR